MADLVSTSTALAFLTKVSQKCKSTSLSAIQVKKKCKIYSSIHTICDNADRIKSLSV